MGGKAITEDQKSKARQLHREGKPCRSIADELGLSHGAVWNIVSHDNIKIHRRAAPARCNVTNAKPVTSPKTKVTVIETQIPDYAPVCATTTRGTYIGAELSYRGRALRISQ